MQEETFQSDYFRRKLYFHVIADSEKLFSRLVNTTASWPEQLKRKVKFMMHDVWYPPVGDYIQTLSRYDLSFNLLWLQERQDMKNMFRVCATERLFIPDMFPALERAIYIDTDLIFLR